MSPSRRRGPITTGASYCARWRLLRSFPTFGITRYGSPPSAGTTPNKRPRYALRRFRFQPSQRIIHRNPSPKPPVVRTTTAQRSTNEGAVVDLFRRLPAGHLNIGRPSMSKRIALLSAVAFSALALTSTFVAPARAEEKTVMVGGAAMFPSKNIIQNAVNSKDHTTLVAAVKAAGLVDTLEGKGPFTVFAPTNAAFGKLPAGTVDNLVKPENKAALTKILTYHVVAGRYDASDLTDGKKLKTVEGEELTVKKAGGKIWIIDAKGDQSMVSISNVHQSNGVIHVVDTVLMPAS